MLEPDDLLRFARRARGWSQRDLAVAAGISHGVVAKIEAGQQQPSWRMLRHLLAVAELDLMPVPAQASALDTDRELVDFLSLHPLDRLEEHGLPAQLIAALDPMLGSAAVLLHGPEAALFWLPPGPDVPAVPQQWTVAGPDGGGFANEFLRAAPLRKSLPPWASRASVPLDLHWQFRSPRIVGPRDLAVAGGPARLLRAAIMWDALCDRDEAGRRDAAHRDPALDDRVSRALWPQAWVANRRRGRPNEWFRQPSWARRRAG